LRANWKALVVFGLCLLLAGALFYFQGQFTWLQAMVAFLGLLEILLNLFELSLKDLFRRSSYRQTTTDLEKEYSDTVLKDMYANGWRLDEAFREVVIMPNSSRLKLEKKDLERIIDSSTVEIAGYGGGAFPYRRTYPKVKEIHHVDGFGLVDNSAWPHQDWSFTYWYFAESGFFLQRTHLFEDHMQNIPSKSLALEWLNLEVARSLLFARKLQSSITDYGEAGVVFRLHGMKDRRLVILNVRRSGFDRDCVSNDVDIEVRATVGPETNLVKTGVNMALEVVWRFGWRQPSEDTIRKDMATLCGGRFPYREHCACDDEALRMVPSES